MSFANCEHTLRLPNGTLTSPKRHTFSNKEEFHRTNSPSGRPGHCVDEICTCAKHACKPAWKPNPAPFHGSTTYGADFDKKQIEPRQAVKPNHVYKPTKFEGETTHHADFQKWDTDRAKSFKPQYNPNSGIPFEGNSSYKTDFDAKQMPAREPRTARGYQPNDAPFDGVTTNKASYVAHPPQERTNFSPSRAVGKHIPFEGQSTAQSDYQKWDIPQREQKDRAAHRYVPDDRDFVTENKREFVPKANDRAQPINRPGYQPNNAPFQGNTTYGSDFDKKQIEPRQAVKPNHVYKPTKFEGETTHHADFQKWDTDRAKSFKPQYNPNSGIPFEGNSSYKTDFDAKQMPAREPRTARGYQPNDAPFDGVTTNKASYVAHPPQERTNFSPSRAVGKHIPFEGQSTAQSDYQKWDIPQREQKDRAAHRYVPDDRDFGSTYKTSFVKPDVPKCPIHELPPAPRVEEGREHVFWDETHSKWY